MIDSRTVNVEGARVAYRLPLRSFAKCRGTGHPHVADAIVRASTSESPHGARAAGTW
jgi:hypothetical protein